MKQAIASLFTVALAASLAPACGSSSSTIGQGKKLVVTITKVTDASGKPGTVGTAGSPNEVSVGQATTFTVDVEAQLPDGTVDTSFNGFINLSVQPGTVSDLPVRNEQLKNGVLRGVNLPVIGVYGQGHIWASDLGYEPAAPYRKPPPQCSDGIDNNNNGLIDLADPGCYASVDDTEAQGSYAAGVSPTLFFKDPRIDLVRGYDPVDYGNGNATAFPHQQVNIDTGWRGGTNYDFSTVVIGLTSAGFYVQDLQDDMRATAPGYAGLYAYNFSTPAFMRVCDRVQLLSGTASDFYGYTELNYPTWQIEYWDPKARPCLVPEPVVLGVADLNNNNTLWKNEATLVRVETAGTVTVKVASHFGPGNVQVDNAHCLPMQQAPCYVPDATHSNCDLNHSGKVEFTDAQEAACATACSGSCTAGPLDYECSEYSQYASQNDFELVVTDTSTTPAGKARLQVNAAAANGFNPLDARAQTVRSFTGLLAYFSGGCQFTNNARCAQDIIYCSQGNCLQSNTQPLASSDACVHPRTQSDINANSQ